MSLNLETNLSNDINPKSESKNLIQQQLSNDSNNNFEYSSEIINLTNLIKNGNGGNIKFEHETLNKRNISPIMDQKKIHRVVFTGGPCAGKTTAINRIKNFFENIGWKVLCVPETSTILLGSGIFFRDMDDTMQTNFQENLLKTLLQIEDTINETARYYHTVKDLNCIVIYDRGAMDPIAYMTPDGWEQLKQKNPEWNEVDLRDNRYDQIIHMITAANGAEQFYSLSNNVTRTESIEDARAIDERCSKAWVGHPCLEVIDNCQIFDVKVTRALQTICSKVGLYLKGFCNGNRKRKFLIKSMPEDCKFPSFQELNVVHNYLVTNLANAQARIRKSGQAGVWSHSYAVREKCEDGQYLETRTAVDRREYAMLAKTADSQHFTVYQKRRCFIWKNRYYRIDIFEEPCNPSCRGLIILSARSIQDIPVLPDFIDIDREITDESAYSMFNLSFKQ